MQAKENIVVRLGEWDAASTNELYPTQVFAKPHNIQVYPELKHVRLTFYLNRKSQLRKLSFILSSTLEPCLTMWQSSFCPVMQIHQGNVKLVVKHISSYVLHS